MSFCCFSDLIHYPGSRLNFSLGRAAICTLHRRYEFLYHFIVLFDAECSSSGAEADAVNLFVYMFQRRPYAVLGNSW